MVDLVHYAATYVRSHSGTSTYYVVDRSTRPEPRHLLTLNSIKEFYDEREKRFIMCRPMLTMTEVGKQPPRPLVLLFPRKRENRSLRAVSGLQIQKAGGERTPAESENVSKSDATGKRKNA